MTSARHSQRGAALITAIMLLVLFAGLSAWMLDLTTSQETQLAQDIQGARALQAARAGVEWGFYQVLDPTHSTVVCPTTPTSPCNPGNPTANPAWPNLPDCPASTTLSIDGFTVTVGCSRTPSGSPGVYQEAGTQRKMRVYEITATARLGTLGQPTYVERSLSSQVSKCRDTAGNAQRGYDCL